MSWFGSRTALVLTVQVLLENPLEIAVHFLFMQRKLFEQGLKFYCFVSISSLNARKPSIALGLDMWFSEKVFNRLC